MRILPFVVNGQKLEKSDNESFESLIRGSTGYLKCSFTFVYPSHDSSKVNEHFK